MSRYTYNKEAYFAVIEVNVTLRDGVTGALVPGFKYDYIGPYDKPGPAKAQVTMARKERGAGFHDGWVEKSIGWERLDAPNQSW